MKCNLEWLSAYLDGVLAEEKRAKLEEHLKTCEACTAKLEEFARVEQAAKKIPAPQLSEAYWENFASRVQNKLTIREKQKTSPGWLEALKSFFQPTTGKLAIAGSVATLLLVAIIGQDYWKKEVYQPPKLEAIAPPISAKIDSVQEPAKNESEFRTAEKDNKVGLVEDKRDDQPVRERGKVTLSQKPTENTPAAAAPLGRMLVAPEGQESKEEPSLAAFAERDDAIEGDTVVVTAGKKAEIRKEVATSQVKVAEKEIETLPIRSVDGLSKLQEGVTAKEDRVHIRRQEEMEKNVKQDSLSAINKNEAVLDKAKQDTATEKLTSEALKLHDLYVEELLRIQRGVTVHTEGRTTSPKSATEERVDKSKPSSPSSDPKKATPGIQELISRAGEDNAYEFAKSYEETLCIVIGNYYLRFNRHWPNWEQSKTANKRLDEFLQKDLSDSTRQRLLQIQGELKKLKK